MKKAVYIFATSLLMAASLAAQTNEVRTLTLQECIELALKNNFDVKIQRFNPTIARFSLEAAYGYLDPVLYGDVRHSSRISEGGGFDRTTGLPLPSSTSDSEDFSVGLAGRTPWGMTYDVGPSYSHQYGSNSGGPYDYFAGSLGTRADIRQPLLQGFLIDSERQTILLSKTDVKRSEAGLTFQMMNVVNQVEQAYYDLIFFRENIKVQQLALELAERLLADNRKRVQVGTLAPLDEKQSESQVAASRADLISAYGQYNTQQNLLKNLLTDNYPEWHAVDVQPKEKLIILPERFDVAESWSRGLSQRPDLQQLKIDLQRSDITLRFQRNQILPSLDITGGVNAFGRDSSFSGVLDDQAKWRTPSYDVGVIFSIPLNNRAAKNNYKAGKAAKEQAVLRVKQAEQTVMVQIDDAIKTARTNLERIESTRKAREYAELALEAEQKKLAAGKSTSFQVLQLQKDLTDARTAEIRAQADYNKALSQLSFSEGSTLERNRLNVAK